jgi:multidrug efflux pump
MSLSRPFIRRPVATTLLTFGLVAAGIIAFFKLPVSPLPDVDIPTISVQATLPGASPVDVATTVASPLERHLGQIADVSEMTSASALGSARVNLQFGIHRDINGAARDVEAAINASRADLPTALRSNPGYRKFNPASAPILIYTLTSDTLVPAELYDAASTVLAQKLSQIEGVGEVSVSGGSLPAVRVELAPQALYKFGIGLEDVRAALASANAHSPKGGIDVEGQRFQIYSNDQAIRAADYKSLVVAYRNGAAVRLTDVGEVLDSVENLRNLGLANGKRAVMMIVYRQPGANIIGMVNRVKAVMPQLRASVSPAIDVNLAVDRSITIRTSLWDVEITLIIAVVLVILVVFAFLRSARATLVPVVAVSVSVVATFAVMYLLGHSLNLFSLMALTVATGFVVDDAIVVLENISRHLDAGTPPLQAALQGSREVGFTVLSMSISLIAVFVPILLMGGLVGRLFREFAMTITVAIGAAAQRARPAARTDLSRERTRVRGTAGRISADAHHRTASSALGHAGSGCGPRPEFLSLRRRTQGFRAAAGYRAAGRIDPGRSKHFVSIDAAEAYAIRQHRQRRSLGRHGCRLHRWRPRSGRGLHQFRHRFCVTQTAS